MDDCWVRLTVYIDLTNFARKTGPVCPSFSNFQGLFLLYNPAMQSSPKAISPFLVLALLSTAFLLVACAWPAPDGPVLGQNQPEAAGSPMAQASPSPANAIPGTAVNGPLPSPQLPLSPTPLASIPSASPRTRYTLSARLGYLQHTVAVEEGVIFTNTLGVALPNLVFLVEPNRYPGAFHLKRLAWEGGRAVEPYRLERNKLEIPLPEPLQPGQRASLSLAYELVLPAIPPPAETTRPVPFGYTERQTNLVDWYPFLPPYDGEQGWLAHDPWYYGEHQVYDLADYQVSILVNQGGLDLVYAASAPAEASRAGAEPVATPAEEVLLRYRLEKARSFAFSASPYYVVFSQQVGDTTVLSYAFPFDQAGGQAALQETAAALALYQTLWGPYPRPTLTVVEADFLDGMEYDGLYFLSRGFYNLYDGTPKGYLASIAVHETAHQWWYRQVANDQALEPWLDEALCTYSEKLFYEHTYPELVDWWWDFRVNFYQPGGPVNGRLYDFNGFRPYVNAVYLRGALFMEDLRQLTGDKAFFDFLKDYADRRAWQIATAGDFFNILADHSPQDTGPLREKYFK